MNFSPRITQITLIFDLFRVNSCHSRLILARPCKIPKSLILFCYVFFVWKGWKGQQWGYAIASVLGLSITPYLSHYDAVFLLPAALILARKKDVRLPMGLFWGFTLILAAWNAFVIPPSSWPTRWPSILPLLPLLIAAVTWIVCRHKTAENSGDVKC